MIDGVPHVILTAKPVMDGVGFLFIIPRPVDSRTDLAEPSVSAVGANVNVRGVERIGCTLLTNPIMPAAGPVLRDPLPHSACCTTEKATGTVGTFCICGVQSVMVGTEPLVRTDIGAVFDRNDRGTIGTNPSLAGCTESRLRRIANGGTKAIPGVVRRTDFVLTVYLTARRTFPAVRTRRIRRIRTVAPFSSAPTVMLRAGVCLQMPNFATGAIPGMVADALLGYLMNFVFARRTIPVILARIR